MARRESGISISVFGETEVARNMLRRGKRVKDARPAFKDLLSFIRKRVDRTFSYQGAFGGARWAPLRPSTVLAKKRKGLSPKILHATLRLRDSLTKAGSDAVGVVKRGELRYGSKVPYGGFHQSRKPRERLPRRAPVQFSEATKREMVKRLQRFIMTGQVVGYA